MGLWPGEKTKGFLFKNRVRVDRARQQPIMNLVGALESLVYFAEEPLKTNGRTASEFIDILNIFPNRETAADLVEGHVNLIGFLGSISNKCRIFNKLKCKRILGAGPRGDAGISQEVRFLVIGIDLGAIAADEPVVAIFYISVGHPRFVKRNADRVVDEVGIEIIK